MQLLSQKPRRTIIWINLNKLPLPDASLLLFICSTIKIISKTSTLVALFCANHCTATSDTTEEDSVLPLKELVRVSIWNASQHNWINTERGSATVLQEKLNRSWVSQMSQTSEGRHNQMGKNNSWGKWGWSFLKERKMTLAFY